MCKLKHLKVLDLSECYRLEKLPEDLGELECLEELNLSLTSISHLPHSISSLKHLKVLDLYGCCKLKKLPENLEGTLISHRPRNISLLKGLSIFGYGESLDADAILFQLQLPMIDVPEGKNTNIEATTCDTDSSHSPIFDRSVHRLHRSRSLP
ncbi:putative leucine-rich repeat domain superfamily [Helianthus anomalus]